MFYTFNSLNVPPTIYRYDIATKKSTVFRQPKVPGYNPDLYETKQVFYPSKDGTKIPMFLVHKKGLKLDGTNPTLLYAYGGFNVVQSPTFSASRLALLEQGFVYANANIRGGGEYGEEWHKQGMKLKKQNVFDDFIAAGEWLIANKYTSSERLAIQGGSNGGLLVGAVINQRPELAKVAIPQVGVMDMLRFHKFTIGWNWIADYGSSDNPDEFKALYAYSPLHNIKAGVKYPATLITTADHDDRVVPAHSFKYAGDAAGAGEQGHADPDPHRHQLRPRREQPDEVARDDRRHLRVHHAQHGTEAGRPPGSDACRRTAAVTPRTVVAGDRPRRSRRPSLAPPSCRRAERETGAGDRRGGSSQAGDGTDAGRLRRDGGEGQGPGDRGGPGQGSAVDRGARRYRAPAGRERGDARAAKGAQGRSSPRSRPANRPRRIALYKVSNAALPVTDFSSDPVALEAGIDLIASGTSAGSTMLEGVVTAAKRLSDRPAPRRAIVCVGIGTDRRHVSEPENGRATRSASLARRCGLSRSRDSRDASLTNRDAVWTRATEDTGGLRQNAVQATRLDAPLQTVANSLLSQYFLKMVRTRDGAVKGLKGQTTSGSAVLFTRWMR